MVVYEIECGDCGEEYKIVVSDSAPEPLVCCFCSHTDIIVNVNSDEE